MSHGGGLWPAKSKTPKNEKDLRTTKTTIKNTKDHFYSIHERKIRKMNLMFHRRLEQQPTTAEVDEKEDRTKLRSVTEPEPYSPLGNFTKQKHCIDLKVLKDAQDQLRRGEHG